MLSGRALSRREGNSLQSVKFTKNNIEWNLQYEFFKINVQKYKQK